MTEEAVLFITDEKDVFDSPLENAHCFFMSDGSSKYQEDDEQ